MKGIFVTGTDTGVGKTVVAGGLLRWLRGRGLDAVPMKPVQTGCERAAAGAEPAELRAPDLDWMLGAAELTADPAEAGLMCPFRYAPACSPHLAGRLAGRPVSIEVIEQCARELVAAHDALVVEGAGGVLAPLNETETMLDLMRRLRLPVVVVAHAGLGTINHTLLTLRELQRAGLPVAGVVFNEPAPDPAAEEAFIRADNPPTIERLGAAPLFGELGHLSGLHAAAPAAAWAEFARALPGLEQLWAMVSSS